MADSRELTFGMNFGLDSAINRLQEVIDNLENVVENARKAGDAGQDIGSDIRAGADTGRDGIDDLTDSIREAEDEADDAGDNIGTNFRQMGAEADSFGAAVGKSMAAAAKETNSVSKTIKAGFDGAIGYSQKKFSDFTGKVKTGIKGIGTAFTHPINTIRGKFLSAVEAAADKINKVGDEADDARKDLDDMGDEGDKAGGEIKEAIKGALAAFIGFEAIQAGIDMLKELGAAAIEAAGFAENVGRKFDANFAGTDAEEWVENYADAVHRSSDEVKSFMVSNKALYGEIGITGDAAAELSKITTSLAYDFGNAFSMDDTEALGVVQDYISGNNAALEEYGIHIDEVALKNSALAMGLGDQIDEMDDATLAQVRMNALLGQTEKIQKSAANSTGGLVNSTKDLKGIWSDFMADAGSRFTPVIESLFNTILDSWPTIEPMLMQFVDMLSNGLARAMPIITELGMTLLPVLTDVLGTVFEAGLPLLQVFGDLAQTVLPPVANIVGMIAETVMPPLVDILNILNTSIIQPLVPVIQKLAEALLPPIAQLLGLISPILEAVSPVLEVIGDVLGVIAEVLGKVVGWLADGVGKVVGFFTNLFGGAKESKTEVAELGDSITDLGTTTENIKPPEIDIPPPQIPEVDPVIVPVATAITDSELGTEMETVALAAADTTPFTKSISQASESSRQTLEETAVDIQTAYTNELDEIGVTADQTHNKIAISAESMWSRMTSAAEAGAAKITGAFQRIAENAQSIENTTVSVGVNIPHNASGTDNFEGGPTYMNEQGGEIAVLPRGSTIIPADKSAQIVNSMTSSTIETRQSVSISPNISIKIDGTPDDGAISRMISELKTMFHTLYQEEQERDYAGRAIQRGFT